MTSNEYNVLKRKINKLEDNVSEMKQDIKDIKMVLERVDNGHKSTTDILQKYGLVDDIMKLVIHDSNN